MSTHAGFSAIGFSLLRDMLLSHAMMESSRALRFMLSVTLVVIGMRVVASSVDIGRTWGLDFIEVSDSVWLLLAFVPFLPPVNRAFDGLLRSDRTARTTVFVLGAMLLASIVLFPMQTFFYGDGGLLIPQIHRMSIDPNHDPSLLLNLKSSPLAGLLLVALTKNIPTAFTWLSIPLPGTALYPFHALSVIVTVAVLAFAVRWKPRTEALLFLLLLFGNAGALLFFGYVEYYLLVTFAFGAYAFSAERFMGGKGKFTLVLFWFVIAGLSHYMAIALLPSFLYLIAIRLNYRGYMRSNRVIAGVFAAVVLTGIAIYFLAGLAWSDNRIVMPLTDIESPAGTLSYTLLSSYHLLDLLNLVLLLSPLGVAVIAWNLKNPDWRDSPAFRFHLLSIGFFSLFLFAANTSLGLARDWDIAAPLGVLISIAAWSALRFCHSPSNRSVLVFASASVFLAMPWLAENIHPVRSAERFASIMELDAQHMYKDYALSGYEALRKHYLTIGDEAHALHFMKKKLALIDYPDHYSSLIVYAADRVESEPTLYRELHSLMLQRLAQKAKGLQASGRDRDYAISLKQIDSLAEVISFQSFLLKEFNAIESELRHLSSTLGQSFPPSAVRGLLAYEKKDYTESVRELSHALHKKILHSRLFLFLGNALALTGDYKRSLEVLEEGSIQFPDDERLVLTFANYAIQSRYNPETVAKLLLHQLDRPISDDWKRETERLLQRLAEYL